MPGVVAIIAGGTSLRGRDLAPIERADVVLAVNDAWRNMPFRPFATITIDTVNLAERFRDCTCPVFAGVPPDYGTPDAFHACDREARVDYITYFRRVPYRDRLTEDPFGMASGENSAFAAVNYAYHMRPRRIVLFGVDLYGMGHHWAPAPYRRHTMPAHVIHRLPANFAGTLPQLRAANIEVINANPKSYLTCFDRVDFETALKMLTMEDETA